MYTYTELIIFMIFLLLVAGLFFTIEVIAMGWTFVAVFVLVAFCTFLRCLNHGGDHE